MSTDKDLGHLEGRMDSVEKDLDEIKSDVRQIRDAVLSVRGGWKTLVVLASISAAVGALGAKLAPLLGLIPR